MNLDFRIGSPGVGTNGQHRFWIGALPNSPAVEVLISEDAVSVRSGEVIERIGTLRAKEWYNLKLTLDLQSQVISGSSRHARSRDEFLGQAIFARVGGSNRSGRPRLGQPCQGGA